MYSALNLLKWHDMTREAMLCYPGTQTLSCEQERSPSEKPSGDTKKQNCAPAGRLNSQSLLLPLGNTQCCLLLG